jgi:hypothetical protein
MIALELTRDLQGHIQSALETHYSQNHQQHIVQPSIQVALPELPPKLQTDTGKLAQKEVASLQKFAPVQIHSSMRNRALSKSPDKPTNSGITKELLRLQKQRPSGQTRRVKAHVSHFGRPVSQLTIPTYQKSAIPCTYS